MQFISTSFLLLKTKPGWRGIQYIKLLRKCTPKICSHYASNTTTPDRRIDQCYKRLDLTFENTREAYRSKSNLELLRGLLVLRLCSVQWLVKKNQDVIKWMRGFVGKGLFRSLMKLTFYGHFVAGEDQNSVKPVVSRMRQYGVKSILDYSVEADIFLEGAAPQPSEPQNLPAKDTRPLPNLSEQLGPAPIPIDRYHAHAEFGDRREGVYSARTYFYQGEPECDRNTETILQCIDAVAHATEQTGFVAVKLTAIGRPSFLLQLSEVIAQTQQFYKVLTGSTWENLVQSRINQEEFLQRLADFGVKTESKVVQDWFARTDFDEDGFVDIYEWGRLIDHSLRVGDLFTILNLKTGQMDPLIKTLNGTEEAQFQNMVSRLNRLAEAAANKGVRVMIDAEQSYFQPAISRLALELMRKYNKDTPVIFNTYQTYLKSALSNARIDMHLARRENFHFGAKLVRGAYMEQERRRAQVVGYEDPINDTYDDTTRMYCSALEEIVNEWSSRPPEKVSVLCATHDEQTVRFAVELMRKHDIDPSARVLCFGQLYGMCDQVSFSLGQAGFSVYKYVPYGPIDDVLPYLSRRAQENNALLGKSQKERQLMWTEVKRRFRTLDWFHGHRKGPFQQEA